MEAHFHEYFYIIKPKVTLIDLARRLRKTFYVKYIGASLII
jgi:hypothetical protein